MPAKFKPSERAYSRNAMGRRMDTAGSKNKKWNHHYLKCQSKEVLFAEINKYNVKPKQRQKCLKELVRRGIKIAVVGESNG
jgi:hypothetical protein